MLCLVYKSIENIIYLFPNVRSEAQKFSVNPMEGRFKKVPLSRILRIEQL